MHKAFLGTSGRARRRQAGHTRRHVLESLEPRRLFAAELISAAAGAPTTTANGASPSLDDLEPGAAAVSTDGRFVAFTSNATNLVAGLSPDGSGDIYVRDRSTGTTVCASVGLDGKPLGASIHYAMSADGRYVAFSTYKSVFPDDVPNTVDVFVRDLQSGTTSLISHTPSGGHIFGDSSLEAMTPDGRYVLFRSDAGGLDPTTPVGGDEDHYYRYDRQAGTARVVTDALEGTDTTISDPRISDDGSKVTFVVATREWWDFGQTQSTFTDLNVYVKDFATGQTTVASVDPAGHPLDA